MRKSIIILTIATLSAAGVSAQGFQLGIRAGEIMNSIDGKSFSEQFKYGYHAGLAAEIMFSKHVGIEPGVYFNQSNLQTGYSFDTLYKSINPGTLKEVRLNYLTIPVLLDVRPLPFLTLQMGPQFGILMSSSNTLLQNGKSAFTNGNLAMVGGVQLNLLKFRIYGRYAVGLNSVNDIDGRDSWRSQSVQLGVGFNL
jgi:hypothetical protein